MANLKEKLTQMILKKPKEEKKVPSLRSYLRKQAESTIEETLATLEKRYPEGFSFKTDEGNYVYSPTKVPKSKAYYAREKMFYPKKPRTESI